jgi:hypothetical protein
MRLIVYYGEGYFMLNKYKIMSFLLLCLSIAIIVVMIVHTLSDYQNYLITLNSAPFSANLIVKGIFYGIPAAAIFVLSVILGKKAIKQ